MTADEKNILYNLLNTTDDWLQGHKQNRQSITFSDDRIYTFTDPKELTQALTTCSACPLGKLKPQQNPLETDFITQKKAPLVMVLGDYCLSGDKQASFPFLDSEKALLVKMLASISLYPNQNTYITSIIKCPLIDNSTISNQYAQQCLCFLDAEIQFYKPQILLAFGKEAQTYLVGQTAQKKEDFFWYGGYPLMITHHPREILKDESLKRQTWEDLKKTKARLDSLGLGQI